MSKYTTEVRFICEQFSGLQESVGLSGVNMVIEGARDKVFDFEYPIFDEEYRPVLETKILKHYYTREIGAETVGLWKLWLNTKMNEIMPYYNKLYKSELLEFNPLYDVDVTTTHMGSTSGSKSDSGNTSVSGSNNANSLDAYSETPQGGVGDLENYNYLSNARKVVDNGSFTNTGTSKLTSTVNDTTEYLEKVSGKRGGQSSSKLLNEYRETFLNIDMQIIEELSDLFMHLW